jgi:uncharacterized heparinase superfamily protein
MTRLLLYANTLRHLRASQIYALIRKRLLPSSHQVPPVSNVRIRPGIGIGPVLTCTTRSRKPYTFEFLNREKTFPEGQIDWICSDMPKLWRYNLHYFDYLSEQRRSEDEKATLISDWIARNSPGAPDAWEPYTLSLRMVNWIKFFIGTKMPIREEWLRSLYVQGLWLERNVEDHLLANHYLKNGVALFFAGVYFDGPDAERWLAKGRQILASELKEQFLADGGHYERSPMYHSISLVDYLDVLNLMNASRLSMRFDEAEPFKARIRHATEFLDDICLPDGEIPLFNDAALGIAPPPSEIFKYARRILAYQRQMVSEEVVTRQKPFTGYYMVRDRGDMMVIDCGAVGPDYQPGHAHADALSFELALNGQRVIVDSGVHDYEPGPRRTYARSTRAHNTIQIDGQDQSEVWGVFRVARRAYPLSATLTSERPKEATFRGAHDGYARLSPKLIHKRAITYQSPGQWTVEDTIEGLGTHTIESFLHLHPSYTVTLVDRALEVKDQTGQVVLTISPASTVQVTIEQGLYFQEFGKEIINPIVVMSYRGALPVTLTCLLTKTLQPDL